MAENDKKDPTQATGEKTENFRHQTGRYNLYQEEYYAAVETAKRAALQRLERSAHLGGGPLPSRDELHDRARIR